MYQALTLFYERFFVFGERCFYATVISVWISTAIRVSTGGFFSLSAITRAGAWRSL
jgi:hypothetical protein